MLSYDEPNYAWGNLTEIEEKAWKLYCKETAGGLCVADFWQELPQSIKLNYLEKVKYVKIQ